jgi:hypothetical protein
MWTFEHAVTRLTDRVAENSTAFWSSQERKNALNDAQRFIAAVTKGVPSTVTGTVDPNARSIPVPGKLVSEYPSGGTAGSGSDAVSLTVVPIGIANIIDPAWRSRIGTPRWVIVSPHEGLLHVTPVRATQTPVSVTVAVIPQDLVGEEDKLFGGESVMEKYQGALINIAAALLMLKERYDGDAERYWGFAVQEMQALGVNPAEIPSLRQAAADG